MDSSIIANIEEFGPRSLLDVTHSSSTALESFCKEKNITYSRIAPQDIRQIAQPADLAIVHDALESISFAEGQQVLGYLRNSLTQSIWLLLRQDADWPLTTLIALGFKKHQDLLPPHAMFRSYTYDINSYNHKRSWNNPRFWANPENFHKFRW